MKGQNVRMTPECTNCGQPWTVCMCPSMTGYLNATFMDTCGRQFTFKGVTLTCVRIHGHPGRHCANENGVDLWWEGL